MGRPALLLILIAAASALAADAALAQGNPFGVARPESNVAPTGGPLGGVFAWIAVQQARLYKLLSDGLTAFQENLAATWSLIGLSFLYGVLHAAGPGHGKAVISSYMLATGDTLKRGIALAFAAAGAQALTAIVLVGMLTVVFQATSFAMTRVTGFVELVSYGLIMAIGIWLVWRKGSAALQRFRDRHHHGHDHDHAHCGHDHAPDPTKLEGDVSIRGVVSTILAVGLRPCSGSVLVLVFAFAQGLYGIGLASAVAIALGVGLTVAVLASIAVGARDLAERLADAESGNGGIVISVVELGAAFAVFGFGFLLFGGALSGMLACPLFGGGPAGGLGHMGAHRITEGPEDRPRGRIGLGPVFGMPLDAEGEIARIANRYRLDRAVVRCRLYPERRGKIGNRLAVQRIHARLHIRQDRGQRPVGAHGDRMLDLEAAVPVLDLFGTVVHAPLLALDFGIERAAERYIELLQAAAHGQKRQAALDGAAGKAQGDAVAAWVVGLVVLVRLGAEDLRVHVRLGAGQENTVDPVQDAVDIVTVAQRRQDQRGHVGHLCQGIHIGVHHRVPFDADEFLQAGRKGDKWLGSGRHGACSQGLITG